MESINALPTFKFKSKTSGNTNDQDNAGAGEGGVLAAGTEKERVISGEDAVSFLTADLMIFIMTEEPELILDSYPGTRITFDQA